MNASLQFLLENTDTLELMRELTPEELKTAEMTQRDFDLGGTHAVIVNGEKFFSFEVWCGRIKSVKRLRARPAPAPKPPVKKWEYMTSEPLWDKGLNDLGNEGWELVAVDGSGADHDARLYFKREKVGQD